MLYYRIYSVGWMRLLWTDLISYQKIKLTDAVMRAEFVIE